MNKELQDLLDKLKRDYNELALCRSTLAQAEKNLKEAEYLRDIRYYELMLSGFFIECKNEDQRKAVFQGAELGLISQVHIASMQQMNAKVSYDLVELDVLKDKFEIRIHELDAALWKELNSEKDDKEDSTMPF